MKYLVYQLPGNPEQMVVFPASVRHCDMATMMGLGYGKLPEGHPARVEARVVSGGTVRTYVEDGRVVMGMPSGEAVSVRAKCRPERDGNLLRAHFLCDIKIKTSVDE